MFEYYRAFLTVKEMTRRPFRFSTNMFIITVIHAIISVKSEKICLMLAFKHATIEKIRSESSCRTDYEVLEKSKTSPENIFCFKRSAKHVGGTHLNYHGTSHGEILACFQMLFSTLICKK